MTAAGAGGADPRARADVIAWAASAGIPAVTPADADYETRRRVYNRMHDAYPVAILDPSDAADVAAILELARTTGLPLAVRGGGHHVAGFGTCDGGIVADLRRLRDVRLATDGQVATVGGGARLGDVDGTLTRLGRVVPTGTVSETGIGGLALGGGIGWLIGRFGLTCDNIVGADVVTGDGRLVRAEDPGHEDLLWALRGGGGGFGVVTAFRFQTHRLPACTVGSLVVPLNRAALALRRLVAFLDTCPPALTVAPVFRIARSGDPVLSVDLCLAGGDDGVLDRLVDAVGAATRELQRDADFAAWQRSTDASFLPPIRGYWKASYKAALSEPDIDALTDAMRHAPTPTSAILIEHLHGRFHEVDADAAAFPLRDARFGVLFSARWPDPSGDAAAIAWARSGIAAIDPSGSTGAYSNYSLADDGRVVSAFQRRPGLGARIERVRATYDPDGLLTRNHLGRVGRAGTRAEA